MVAAPGGKAGGAKAQVAVPGAAVAVVAPAPGLGRLVALESVSASSAAMKSPTNQGTPVVPKSVLSAAAI